MGNTDSKAQIDLKKQLAIRGYSHYQTLENSLIDKNMGGAEIWKRTQQGSLEDPEFLFVKEKMSMNMPEYNRISRALEARDTLVDTEGAEAHLGRLIFQTNMVDNSWCTNYYKTYTATEYFANNLEYNLRMKRDLNQDVPEKHYTEEELRYVMGSAAHGAMALKNAGIYHGDIQPKNIMMDNATGAVKLMEKPLIMSYYNGFRRMLFDQDYQAALSPQQLTALRNARLNFTDPETARAVNPSNSVAAYGEPEEVWAVGLSMLSASNNHPMNRYYDWNNYVVNWDMIEFDSVLMKNRGLSAGYISMIQKCLNENPNLRPTLEEVFNFANEPIQH